MRSRTCAPMCAMLCSVSSAMSAPSSIGSPSSTTTPTIRTRHILFRGKDEQGQDLILRREYIGYGIRQRASEAATDLLGERTEKEMEQAREKEMQAERFTSLDRTIERNMDEKNVIDVSPDVQIGWRRSDRPLVIGACNGWRAWNWPRRFRERSGSLNPTSSSS